MLHLPAGLCGGMDPFICAPKHKPVKYALLVFVLCMNRAFHSLSWTPALSSLKCHVWMQWALCMPPKISSATSTTVTSADFTPTGSTSTLPQKLVNHKSIHPPQSYNYTIPFLITLELHVSSYHSNRRTAWARSLHPYISFFLAFIFLSLNTWGRVNKRDTHGSQRTQTFL